jgi:hypothetical protein
MTPDDDAPRPACPCCHRPGDTWHVCVGCVTRVDTQLGELLDLHALAPLHLQPGSSGDHTLTGVAGSRPPCNLAALDVALGEEALGILEGWERWWREHWSLTPYGVASAVYAARSAPSGAGLGSTATSRTLTGVVGFLRAWWPRAAEVVEPPPDEFADEVRRLWVTARSALQLHEPAPWTVACPTDGCGKRLRVEHDGRTALVRCPRCGVERTLPTLMMLAREDGRPCWVDAPTAAWSLGIDVAHLGPMVRDGRLRSRGDRDCRQYDVNSLRDTPNTEVLA